METLSQYLYCFLMRSVELQVPFTVSILGDKGLIDCNVEAIPWGHGTNAFRLVAVVKKSKPLLPHFRPLMELGDVVWGRSSKSTNKCIMHKEINQRSTFVSQPVVPTDCVAQVWGQKVPLWEQSEIPLEYINSLPVSVQPLVWLYNMQQLDLCESDGNSNWEHGYRKHFVC